MDIYNERNHAFKVDSARRVVQVLYVSCLFQFSNFYRNVRYDSYGGRGILSSHTKVRVVKKDFDLCGVDDVKATPP